MHRLLQRRGWRCLQGRQGGTQHHTSSLCLSPPLQLFRRRRLGTAQATGFGLQVTCQKCDGATKLLRLQSHPMMASSETASEVRPPRHVMVAWRGWRLLLRSPGRAGEEVAVV